MMKKICFKIIIITTIVHFALQSFYRPFIFNNGIFDFFIANSFTNITSVIGISAIMLFFDEKLFYTCKFTEYFIFIIPTVSMIIYEIFQIYISYSTFSFTDILFSLIGGVIVYFIKIKIYDKFHFSVE